MAYEENPDPLLGKGRRHSLATRAVLGISKAIIVDEPEVVNIPIISTLQQGDLVSWKNNATNFIGVVNNSGKDTYTVAIIEPDSNSLLGVYTSVKSDDVKQVQNKGKEFQVYTDVIIYWRDNDSGKMLVGKGTIMKRERTDVMGMFPDFYTYEVMMEKPYSGGYPMGYMVHVYEYRGLNAAAYDKYDRFPYKVNRIWKAYEHNRLNFLKETATSTEHIWTKSVNSFVSLAIRALKHGAHWVVTYRWEIENKNHEVVSQDNIYTKVYKNEKDALKDAEHIMDKVATLDDYKNFSDKRIVELYQRYLLLKVT